MKKRLLFINGHLNSGGVEKSLVDILTSLDYSKYDVDLLLLEGLGDYESMIPPQVHVRLKNLENTYGPVGASLRRCIQEKDWLCFRMRFILLLRKFGGPRRISLAKKLLTENVHYDCAIGFRSGICTEIASFAVNADRRLSWWHHGAINVNTEKYLEETQNCNRIAVVSDACKEMLLNEMPTLEEKLVVIPNMLHVDEIQIKANDFLPDYCKDQYQIVSVGRLAPEKHFENAIYTAKKLKDQGIAFQWHLVGEGESRPALEHKIREMGLTESFILEGNQPNPYPYVKNADVFVHPSYVESQGIVILEAMTLGIPCVVTKSLGPCEFIQDGVNGILTEQSPESLCDKVFSIIENRDLYQRIKSNTKCPEQFLAENVIQKIEEVIEG